MHVLLIEDDASTVKSVELILKSEGFTVDSTDLGEDGLEIGQLYDYDIIILDLMLPDIDGYEVLGRLRAAQVKTPVLILSGLSAPDNKREGLSFGADDYLTKPFDKGEFVARVRAVVRRSKGYTESVIRTGNLTINLYASAVTVDEQPLHLTGKEYGVLVLLSLRKETVVKEEMLLDHLYGGVAEPGSETVDEIIGKLRKKLAAVDGDDCIKTVEGYGYVLRDPVGEAAPAASEPAAAGSAS